MTAEELSRLLDAAASILETNKSMATPQFLATVESAVAGMRESPRLLAAAAAFLGKDHNEVISSLTSLGEAVAIERRLTDGDVTETAVKLVRKIKSSPIILSLLASLV